jgi:hypothetical protein
VRRCGESGQAPAGAGHPSAASSAVDSWVTRDGVAAQGQQSCIGAACRRSGGAGRLVWWLAITQDARSVGPWADEVFWGACGALQDAGSACDSQAEQGPRRTGALHPGAVDDVGDSPDWRVQAL